MSSLTGTGRLVRLVLRRDRVKLPIWIVAIAAIMFANIPAVINIYGGSVEKQLTYAATTAPSVVGRVFGGPINGPDIGSIVLNEVFLFAVILAAFMNTLLVVRHTRQNEETGREELISSAVVGRYASLTAALLVAFGANLLLVVLVAASLVVNNLSLSGSIATGMAVGSIGMIFALIAATTSQVAESARGANSLAAAAIGIAFVLRALGDSMGELVNNGMGVVSAWPSWLSPIGWGQQIYPFTEDNWWVLGLFGLCGIVLTVVAFVLNAHRDVGLGMVPARRGPAVASRRLLSTFGLAWRLQRGVLYGWVISMAIMGVTLGLVVEEFKNLFTENQQVAQILGALGGNNVDDIIIGSTLSLMAIAMAGYAIQGLLRMRSEESTGHLEPVLATNVSRWRWMISHISWVIVGVITLAVVLGATAAITYVWASGAPWSDLGKFTIASVVHVPAVLVIAGFVVAVFGLLPRWVISVTWTGFAVCLLMGQFGALLKLPQWLLNISPFSHTPFAPATSIDMVPLAWLLVVALVFMSIGLLAFRRRDLATA